MSTNDRNEHRTASHALQWITHLAELHTKGILTIHGYKRITFDNIEKYLRGEKTAADLVKNKKITNHLRIQDFEIFGTNQHMLHYVAYEITHILGSYGRCANGGSSLKFSAETLLEENPPSAHTVGTFLNKFSNEAPALALGLAAEVCPLYNTLQAPPITLDAGRVYFTYKTDYMTQDMLSELSNSAQHKPFFDTASEALEVFKSSSLEKITLHQNGHIRSGRKDFPNTLPS